MKISDLRRDDLAFGNRQCSLPGLLPILFLLTSTLLLIGCPSSTTSSTKSKTPKEDDTKYQVSTRQCAEQFENSYQLMLPESLGLEADSKTAILLMNEWYNSCGRKMVSPDGDESAERLASDLPDSDIGARVANTNFDTRDVSHIRTSILCREIVEHATKNDRTDLNRAITLFDYTVRNISIAPNVAERVPRTLFEVLLFGLGGYEDRVWLFANLMRQLRVDVVAISPAGDPDDGRLLAGVLLNDNVYLFDPVSGSPVFVPAAQTENDPTPATWKDVVTGKVKINGFADAGSAPNVFVIGNASLWAPRMSAVQEQFVGDKDYLVHETFASTSEIKGPVNRVSKIVTQTLTDGKMAQVTVWDYPLKRIEQFENPSEQESAIIGVMMAPFRTTSTVTKTNTRAKSQKITLGENEYETTQSDTQEQQFRMARLAQLQGQYDAALPAYFKIRLDHSRRIAASLGSNDAGTKISRVIAEDSHYWTGLSQYEKGKYDQAVNTLSSYLKKFDNRLPGNETSIFRWSNSAITLLAKSLAQQGKYAEALAVLKMMPDVDSESERTEALKARWSSLLERSTSEKDDE